MNTVANKPGKINRRLRGEPIPVGGRSVQLVARLFGYVGSGGGRNGSGGGGWLRLTPQEVIVHEESGAEQRLALPDPTAVALRGIASAGLALAALAWLMMILAWVLRFRRTAGE